MTIATRPFGIDGSSDLVIHPEVVLERYEGWPSSLDAPDWTRRKPGRKLVFTQSKAELAEFLSRVATWRDSVNVRVTPCVAGSHTHQFFIAIDQELEGHETLTTRQDPLEALKPYAIPTTV